MVNLGYLKNVLNRKKNMGSEILKYTDKDYIDMAAELAEENVLKGGGPFGAVIVRDGKIIATGVNTVTLTNDLTVHAEINAVRKACEVLGTFKLDRCIVYSSCEPCPMCLSALYWAGVKSIYYGNTKEDADAIEFSDRFIYAQLDKAPRDRAIPCIKVNSERAIRAFRMWNEKVDKKVY